MSTAPSPLGTRLPRAAVLGVVLGLVLAACGTGAGASVAPSGAAAGGACTKTPEPADVQSWTSASADPNVIPVVVSDDLACGANRFMFSFIDKSNSPIAAPDRAATVTFFDLSTSKDTPVAKKDGTFVWAIEGARGVYVTSMAFPTAGIWGAEFTLAPKGGGASVAVRMAFEVRQTGLAKRVGDKAPASKTPTASDVGGDLRKLSSDASPLPAFYQTSVDQAVASGKPFVLAFATPKFCTSGQCGPTLDRLKPFVAKYPDVTFINVEPYQLKWDGTQLQPVLTNNNLTPVQATLDYGLTMEPWVYVVDRSGVITASFEGLFGDQEMTAALDALK